MIDRNIRLIVSYDGTRYQGWQRLKQSDNTIQGKIENVLSKMTGEKIEVIASGRTDAGVHARNQVCNFRMSSNKSIKNMMTYMNGYLPEDIVIKDVKEVGNRFHSRYNVKEKTYIYRIWTHNYPPIFERKYVYHVADKLNIDKMKNAARLFEGEHDFQGFCSRKMKKSTIRTIYKVNIEKLDGELRIEVTGNGFLYNMVRIMVGTLLDIGKNKLQENVIEEVLATKNRSKAGEKAPAQGLILYDVKY